MVKTLGGLKKYGVEVSNGNIRRYTWVFAKDVTDAFKKARDDDYCILRAIEEKDITAQDVVDYMKSRLEEFELTKLVDKDFELESLKIVLSEIE